MNANDGLVFNLHTVLEWSVAKKSRLILGFLLFIICQSWGFQYYQLYYPSPFVNQQLLLDMGYGLPALVIWTLLLIRLTYVLEKKGVSDFIVSLLCVLHYSVVLIVLGYLIGLLSFVVGVVLTGGPIVCLVLFQRVIGYISAVVSFSLILGVSVLSAFGYLPYAPIYQPTFFYMQEARSFNLFCTFFFALPHYFFMFGIFDLLLMRWRQRERRIHLKSLTDELTSLYNRRAIIEHLQHCMQWTESRKKPLSVIVLDVDFFKRINDQFGHTMGDKALQAVSLTLQSALREADKVGRYGGEEFLIVLGDSNLDQAAAIAERCRVALSHIELMSESQQWIPISASFGVSCSEQVGYCQQALIHQADLCLYAAKQNGRNQVVANLNY